MQQPRHLAAAAMAFDRDDPFVGRRIMSHARLGIQMHNYEKSRRLPAPIEERFRLSSMRKK